ncbi:MAG: DUF4387 domain-containing protein [Clostridia bacterium]|nr:DUF4387 domain-containing protein [Clostridia bacterium]
MKVKLKDAAKVIRSKNSGPYELTFDIIFRTKELFEAAVDSKVFTRELIAGLYSVDEADVADIVEFIPAKAIKATIRRKVVSGGPGDRDVYGAQQHAPLFDIEFEAKGENL